MAVDRPHHLGVEAEAGVEGEIPVTRQAQADAAVTPFRERLEDLPGRVDGIGGQPRGAGEDVGVAAGQGRERGDVVSGPAQGGADGGRIAGRGASPRIPLTASLTVPSPPSVSTSPKPSLRACAARLVAWPR